MRNKHYRILINAPRQRVWEVLWGEHTYPEWTSAFAEGSKVKTDWEQGGKILFLNAENEGMVARIEEKKEPEKMVFKHLGMVDKTGKEDLESEKVKAWSGAKEIYLLKDFDASTELTVEMDLDEGHESFFDEVWPKAMEKVQDLAEVKHQEKRKIVVTAKVKAPVDRVWDFWTKAQHITQWNYASDDWHSPTAENDLREKGKFSYRMEAKDGSAGFDFEGFYDKIKLHRHISYTIEDGRRVDIKFQEDENSTVVEEAFEADQDYPLEMQQQGWQAILDNFKAYVEKN